MKIGIVGLGCVGLPELPEDGLRSDWPDDVDCAVIVTAYPGLDLERVVRL
jgi:hypothetical protein